MAPYLGAGTAKLSAESWRPVQTFNILLLQHSTNQPPHASILEGLFCILFILDHLRLGGEHISIIWRVSNIGYPSRSDKLRRCIYLRS